MKKLSLLFLAAVFIFSGFAINASAASFSDLKEGHRFYKEMLFLEGEDIISGFPNGTFQPDGEVTRAAAAIMIGRALNLDGEQKETGFSDVGAEQKASGYIASAVEEGIIQGYPDKTYRPDATVTRGQMAIFLSRAFKLTTESDSSFTDITPSMASYSHIKRIIAENLTQGYSDSTFRPDVKVTRAQFSAFLARALNDEFKVELPAVYLKDTKNVYYYHSKVMGYYYTVYTGDYPDWNLWTNYFEDGETFSFVERQDGEGYKYGYPYSEYTLKLAAPFEVGNSWENIYGEDLLSAYEITATDLTVTTEAGTFNNVIEVTERDGWVDYYAPNIGIIKATMYGETTLELMKIN